MMAIRELWGAKLNFNTLLDHRGIQHHQYHNNKGLKRAALRGSVMCVMKSYDECAGILPFATGFPFTVC